LISFICSSKCPALHAIDGEVLPARQRFVIEGRHSLRSADVEVLVQPQPEPALAAADDQVVAAGPHDVVVLASHG